MPLQPLVLPPGIDMHKCLQNTCKYYEEILPDFDLYDFAAGELFGLITYDYDLSKIMVRNLLRVCRAITEGTTSKFISDEADYITFITMVNMTLFSGRLDWGTSIRGCWWVTDEDVFDAWLKVDDHPNQYSLTKEQWVDYMRASFQIFDVD